MQRAAPAALERLTGAARALRQPAHYIAPCCDVTSDVASRPRIIPPKAFRLGGEGQGEGALRFTNRAAVCAR